MEEENPLQYRYYICNAAYFGSISLLWCGVGCSKGHPGDFPEGDRIYRMFGHSPERSFYGILGSSEEGTWRIIPGLVNG